MSQKTDSSSSCESFTGCQEEPRTIQQNRIDSIVKVQCYAFRQQGFLEWLTPFATNTNVQQKRGGGL